jgi:hypothetical protein
MSLRNVLKRIRTIPKRTLVLFAFLGVAVFVMIILKEEEEKDFTPLFQLEAIKGSNTLPILFLSGKFTESWRPRPGAPAQRDGQFEMYILGTKAYYLKSWHGDPTNRPGMIAGILSQFFRVFARRYSGWSHEEIIVDDFEWTSGKRWGQFGTQGGGGGGDGHSNWLAPGRRLWNQSGFVGAIEEGQVNKEWYATETFKDLKAVGGFRIPRVIQFDRNEYSQTYRVQKCEFRDGPALAWFLAKKKVYDSPYGTNATLTTTNVRSTN